MTPEELTAAAAHSREAMTAIRHIAREGGTGGMSLIMRSAEDVPALLGHIAERDERIACHVEEADLLRAALTRAEDDHARGRAKVDNLGHALDIVQLREIRQDATIARLETVLREQGHRADPAESRCPQRCKACAALREPTTTPAVPEKETTP